MLHPNIYIIHLTPSDHVRMHHLTSAQEEKGEHSTIWYSERSHIHITFMAACCYSCSIVLLAIINLLLCLVYKLNFIMGMWV